MLTGQEPHEFPPGKQIHSKIKAVGHPIEAGPSEAERELRENSQDGTGKLRCEDALPQGSTELVEEENILNMSVLFWVAARAGLGEGRLVSRRHPR